mmetsp:Transcript_35513/g.86080  ORF Transcript_35513/g.86080 Transcript_35513/m.86080 type:complete len:207 (-) Transcript_35513:124-744(-)
MCVLSHFWSGSQTSTNGPNWLVGNSDVRPFGFSQKLGKRLQLLGANFHGNTRFALFLLFANGEHDLESLVKGDLALFGAKGLSLTDHSETFTTFGVANDDPCAANILQHVGADFTGEGAILDIVSTVLGSNLNVVTKRSQAQRNVQVWDAKDDFDIVGDGSSSVENVDSLGVLVVRSVGLPVSSNQVFTLSDGLVFDGGSLRTASL